MIIDYKLTYPSGTATAVLINGFHTIKGDKMAKYFPALSSSYISESTYIIVLEISISLLP